MALRRGYCFFVLIAFTLSCQKKLDLKDSNHRLSYAVGVQFAKTMSKDQVSLNPDVVALAIKHVKDGTQLKLSEEDMQTIFKDLHDFSARNRLGTASNNLIKSKEFMELNARVPKIKKMKSGIQYLVLSEGKGKPVTIKNKVKMHYVGYLMNGAKFDSTYDRREPTVVAATGLVKGLAEALTLMKAGGKYKVFIPPQLGYGVQGSPGAGVPSNMALTYEVELLDVF